MEKEGFVFPQLFILLSKQLRASQQCRGTPILLPKSLMLTWRKYNSMVLNLHGGESFEPLLQRLTRNLHALSSKDRADCLSRRTECPSKGDVTILNAETKFLPILSSLSLRFPKLRICLEHLTTAAAVETVEKLGKTVAGTITAHHLHLIVDDWAGNPINYCKPVAKTVADRTALLHAAASGNPKFFFGSDSAPHPVTSKRAGEKVAAGVFTQPYTTQLVIEALERGVEMGVLTEEDVTLEKFKGFMSGYGRDFYGLKKQSKERIEITKGDERIIDVLESKDGTLQVVPFRKGESTRSLKWIC